MSLKINLLWNLCYSRTPVTSLWKSTSCETSNTQGLLRLPTYDEKLMSIIDDIEEYKSQYIFDNFQKFAKIRIFVNFEHFLPSMVA